MTVACTIDATGISAPDYPTVLAELQSQFRAVYGADLYLEPDSQDGAMLAIFALAITDTNSATIAAYNAFSPATAQGEGLSRVVKINGIARLVPSYSTADVLIVGTANTPIVAGSVVDPNRVVWVLPDPVTIPFSGQVVVTATCSVLGAIAAPVGALNTIGTPTRGWQSVTNPRAATLGQPVETDAALRQRQTLSTSLPSRSIMEGVIGAVLSLPGVLRVRGYDNDTAATDANGLPSHSIALVVDGGDSQAIGNAIGAKKGPGVGTFGTTSVSVTDVFQIPHPIQFYRPTLVPVFGVVRLTAQQGFTTAMVGLIQQAIADYINALPIAASVRLTRLYVPVDAVSPYFSAQSIVIGRSATTTAPVDLAIAFNEAATCAPANISVVVA